MNIIVFGGAGDVGSRAVEDLARTEGVDRLAIADRAGANARRLASSIKNPSAQIEVVEVDARDPEALKAAMRGYDVAASALGPFYEFEPKLVQAAVEAGVHYTSVCDDFSAAQELFEKYDQPARERGVIILTGLGTSPGLTNMGVRLTASEMDVAHRAEIFVYQPLDGGGEAVLRHVLYVMTGDVAEYTGSRIQNVRALSQSVVVNFPKFGEVRLWNMGHTEPVTLHRFLPSLNEVKFYMGYGRGAGFFVWPCRLRLLENPRVQSVVCRVLAAIETLIPKRGTAIGAVRIDVYGEREGQEVLATICGVGNMREATGLSLAVGTRMLARGETTVTGGGVFAPEGCLDPMLFFQRMQERGITAYRDLDMSNQVAGAKSPD
ncbi:MAG TPA: saccharopine dehydrogenase NADP-binding domain-containing protein [Candidatus Hydrogenedentes bacterium]|nr:saccharopine dehydrogenase NADP-binding domain-containing protein [Candidatus Hydrogenedentota bacterium]